MSAELRIGFFVHSVRSDWNNGNAHFLRGLLRAMGQQGHNAIAFEQQDNWSVDNLLLEGERGRQSLAHFGEVYPDIDVEFYRPAIEDMRDRLSGFDIVIVHEWNTPALVDLILTLRDELGFRALFHDTHHRASSSPEAIRAMQVARFDGVIAFGESLRRIYKERFSLDRVWTLHEAADTSVFYPREAAKTGDIVWIGNWGDDERSAEIRDFLLAPVDRLKHKCAIIYGVRYPWQGLTALADAGIAFGGYLPNLDAPAVYAASRLTVHVPRQQYNGAMDGIPTIRVFEALASGIPLISAPWRDTEQLFRETDFCWARTGDEMAETMRYLIDNPAAAQQQAQRGIETVCDRHTCAHRAAEMSAICEEVLAQ